MKLSLEFSGQSFCLLHGTNPGLGFRFEVVHDPVDSLAMILLFYYETRARLIYIGQICRCHKVQVD